MLDGVSAGKGSQGCAAGGERAWDGGEPAPGDAGAGMTTRRPETKGGVRVAAAAAPVATPFPTPATITVAGHDDDAPSGSNDKADEGGGKSSGGETRDPTALVRGSQAALPMTFHQRAALRDFSVATAAGILALARWRVLNRVAQEIRAFAASAVSNAVVAGIARSSAIHGNYFQQLHGGDER